MPRLLHGMHNPWQRAAAILILLYILLMAFTGLWHHWGYLTDLNDLGIFDQVIWGTLHGHWFLNTDNPYNAPINWLGYHFNPILAFFVPLYWLYPSPSWLMLAQAAALGLAAWPIYRLASHKFRPAIGFFWALAFLINPFVLNAASWDFHPVVLDVPFIAAAFWAIEKKNIKWLYACCLVLCVSTEHFGLAVMGFGLFWAIRNRTLKPAAGLVLLGALQFYLVLGVIMPALSPTGEPIMMSKGMGQLSRYAWLGSSVKGVMAHVLQHPVEIANTVLLQMGGKKYLLWLIFPFMGLPLLAPEFLLPGLSDLAANLLSSNPMPRSIAAYHSVTLIPVVTVAALYGAYRLSGWIGGRASAGLAGLVVWVNVLLAAYLMPFPFPGALNLWRPVHFMSWPDPALPKVRAVIKPTDSISAQANIGAHFSERSMILRYPEGAYKMDKIILRLDSPTLKLLPSHAGVFGTLAYHLQMQPADYLESIECLLDQKKYGIVLWQDPWLVLSPQPGNPQLTRQVQQKIDRLKRQWPARAANAASVTLPGCR